MKCLFYFKEKSKITERKSAPELKETRKSDNSSSRRVAKSASSVGGSTASPNRSLPELFEEKAHNLRVFSLSELRNATNDFSRLLKIGEGGFGSVYKGFVRPADGKGDRIVVAIKRLNKDGLQVWSTEISFLLLLHPFCIEICNEELNLIVLITCSLSLSLCRFDECYTPVISLFPIHNSHCFCRILI